MSASNRYQAVVERIVADTGATPQEAEEAFEGLLQFLDVAASTSEPVSPSLPIDAAWHAFILHTRSYAEYCQETFGAFVHHQPTGADRATNRENYFRAREMAATKFGRLDARMWPEALPARCHDGTPCER